MKSVCYQCPDRAVVGNRSCHSTCKKYLNAKAEHEQARAAKLADALEHQDAEGVKRRSIAKIKRRINGR